MMSWLSDSVPVLMYHHILPQKGFIASSVKQFRAQMGYLAKSGYKTLTIKEFEEFKKSGTKPKKSVLITFDDGWRDNLIYAYPILKEFGLKATLFVITEWIERASSVKRAEYSPKTHKEAVSEVKSGNLNSVLGWDELEKMRDVFEIESHGHSHRDFYFGREYSWSEECEISKQLLKSRLGVESHHLCWPRGRFDEGSREIALKHFDYLYTTIRGANTHDDEVDIRRISTKEGAWWMRKSMFVYSSSLLASVYGVYKK